MTGTRLNDCTPTPAELARYTMSPPPPNAAAMELAKHLYNMARYPASNDDGGKRTIDGIARALTAYGDQRAREARQQILVDSTPLREAVAREARAAAIKEAMQDVRDFFDSPDNRGVLDDLPLIEQLEQRRALAAAPPQSEGGEG